MVKELEEKICNWEGCKEEGGYPAPKSKYSSKLHYWFCLKHIRVYNAKWDYFSDMDEREIENFQKNYIYEGRPTWNINYNYFKAEKEIKEKIYKEFSFSSNIKNDYNLLTDEERKALKILKLSLPTTLKLIKAKYKELAKIYHPDMSEQKDKAEERFKKISQAYNLLRSSNFFKDKEK